MVRRSHASVIACGSDILRHSSSERSPGGWRRPGARILAVRGAGWIFSSLALREAGPALGLESSPFGGLGGASHPYVPGPFTRLLYEVPDVGDPILRVRGIDRIHLLRDLRAVGACGGAASQASARARRRLG